MVRLLHAKKGNTYSNTQIIINPKAKTIWVLHNSKKCCTFARDDNNIDYRTADSAAGYDARLGFRLSDKG